MIEVGPFIEDSFILIRDGVENANLALKKEGIKVALPKSLKLEFALTKDRVIIWNPMQETAVAQLTFEVGITPEGPVGSPATEALAATGTTKTEKKKEKGK